MNDNIEKNAAKEQQIAKLAAQIELHDSNAILSYGTGVQKKIADFSESALASVRTKDLGEAGALLGEMIGNLKRFNVNEEPKRGLLGLFRRGQKNLSALQTKYKSAESNVEKVCTLLEDHQVQLMKDVALLDKMYETNQQNFEELSLYICLLYTSAVLVHLETLGIILLIFDRVVVSLLALTARQGDLNSHTLNLLYSRALGSLPHLLVKK